MRKVAPEVERLMWLIAEQRDPRAIADFESRFPELKLELAKHMAMVSGLKTAGKKMPEPRIPRFVPRHAAVPRKQTGLYIAVAFVAGALAFGSYAGFTLLRPAKQEAPVVRIDPPNQTNSIQPQSEQQPIQKSPPVDPAPNTSAPAPEQRAPELQDPLQKPVTFDVDAAPLKVAIAMICKAAGISAETPLALPEEDVSLHCDNLAAGDVLNELGRAHGFTVFPQELGKVLLLPGRPTSNSANQAVDDPQEATGDPRIRENTPGLTGRENDGSGR